MTVAVCLRCGTFKHGAFNRCSECGYTPHDDESLTKHLLVTDHYLSREQLEAISERVKAGQPVEFAAETLREAWVSKEQLDAETKRLSRGCAIGCIVIVVLAAAAFMIGIWHPW